MSDQPGLSIFETASSSADASFPLARRGGYDSDAVDAWVRTQSAEFQRAVESLRILQSENEDLLEVVEKLKERLEAIERPNYTGLGHHAAQLLGLAEQEAADVRSRAVREADEVVKSAQEEAANILASAHHDAEQDAQNMRLSATRDVEQARAAADREVTEARRVLAVEKERLAREASENHTSAMEQTGKLVQDAETRAKAAEERARDIMAQAAKARDASSTDTTRLLENAKTEAAQLVTSAKAEAQKIRVSATAEAERQTRLLRSEVEELQRRREGIMAQMGQLRDIVSTFAPTVSEQATADDEAAAEPDAAESDETPVEVDESDRKN